MPVHFLKRAAIERLVGTLPVIAMNGTESRKALASEIGRFAEPGPQEVKVAVGRPETR